MIHKKNAILVAPAAAAVPPATGLGPGSISAASPCASIGDYLSREAGAAVLVFLPRPWAEPRRAGTLSFYKRPPR